MKYEHKMGKVKDRFTCSGTLGWTSIYIAESKYNPFLFATVPTIFISSSTSRPPQYLQWSLYKPGQRVQAFVRHPNAEARNGTRLLPDLATHRLGADQLWNCANFSQLCLIDRSAASQKLGAMQSWFHTLKPHLDTIGYPQKFPTPNPPGHFLGVYNWYIAINSPHRITGKVVMSNAPGAVARRLGEAESKAPGGCRLQHLGSMEGSWVYGILVYIANIAHRILRDFMGSYGILCIYIYICVCVYAHAYTSFNASWCIHFQTVLGFASLRRVLSQN